MCRYLIMNLSFLSGCAKVKYVQMIDKMIARLNKQVNYHEISRD